jgi:hypothetical protein
MAAVFALVFLFAVASIALLGPVFVGQLSLVSLVAFGLFVALAGGVFVGCFRMARTWEADH